MWYLGTAEYYLAIRKNEAMPFAGKWVELETIKLSEIRQTQEMKYYMSSLL